MLRILIHLDIGFLPGGKCQLAVLPDMCYPCCDDIAYMDIRVYLFCRDESRILVIHRNKGTEPFTYLINAACNFIILLIG